MSQNVFRDGYNPATFWSRTSQLPSALIGRITLKPAIALVFLMAIVFSVFTVTRNSAQVDQIAPATTQTQVTDESVTTEEPVILEPAVGTDDSNASSAVNSVKVESTVTNGQASTNVEINGNKVEVPANGSVTQTTTEIGNQSTSNVIIQNNQTSADGMSFGTSTSTSFSHSYDSAYAGGMH